MKKLKIRNLFAVLLLCAGLLLTGCNSDGFEGNMSDVSPKEGDLIAEFEIEGFGTIKAVLFPEAAPMGVENFQKLADEGFYNGLTIHRVVEDFMFQGGSTNGNGTGGEAAINGGSFGVEASQKMRHFYGALCYANAAGQNSTQFYIVNSKASFNAEEYENAAQINEAYAKMAEAEGMYAYAQYYQSQAESLRDYIKRWNEFPNEVRARYDEKGGSPMLDGDFTVFGQVYEGFDVIDEISSIEVEDNGSGEESKPVEDIIIKSVRVTVFGG